MGSGAPGRSPTASGLGLLLRLVGGRGVSGVGFGYRELIDGFRCLERPVVGSHLDQSVVGLFKIGEDGVNAERVQVKLGRSSVNTIEVLSGLKVGDQVILSDMSAYDAYDRIRLK